MKQTIKNLTYTLLAASTLCACSTDTEPIVPSQSTNMISFSPFVDKATRLDATLSFTQSALQNLQDNGFKVFANTTPNNWKANGATSEADFMYGQVVEYTGTGTDAHWGYTPEKEWPSSGLVSFFAYSPYDAASITTVASESDALGATQVTYTLPAQASAHQDLIAAACFNRSSDNNQGVVDFDFYHTLSRLKFTATTSQLAQGTTIDITKLAVRYADGAIRHKAVLDLAGVSADMTHSIWSDCDTPSYFTAADNNLDAGSVLDGEQLLIIPQAHQAGALQIVLSYTLTTVDDQLASDIVKTVTDKVIALPAITEGWQPNKQYTYALTITPDAVSFDGDIQVTAWDTATAHEAHDAVTPPLISYSAADDAFHIGNAEGLVVFRDIIHRRNKVEVPGYSGTPNSTKANAILDNDIDLSTVCGPELGSWLPIGDYNSMYKTFNGTFDGNNHSIDNLYIDEKSSRVYGRGLFATGEECTIKNVTLRAVYLNNPYDANGSLLGRLYKGTIENCHLAGTDKAISISGRGYVGGLIGKIEDSTVLNSTVQVGIGGMSIVGNRSNAGGFAGSITGSTVRDCGVYVSHGACTIHNDITTGGFAGLISNCNIFNSSVDCGTGTIDLTGLRSYIGGFVGQITTYTGSSKVVGCYSAVTSVDKESTLTNNGYFGGSVSSITLRGCWAYCQVAPSGGKFHPFWLSRVSYTKIGTSQITDMEYLNEKIESYNAGKSPDLQAKLFSMLGTYGPIVSTQN